MPRGGFLKRHNTLLILFFAFAFNLVHQLKTGFNINLEELYSNGALTLNPTRLIFFEDSKIVNYKTFNNQRSNNATRTSRPPWENFPSIPNWMKDYFSWHQQQRQAWNATYWRSYRYLVMSCPHNQKCGGTADRLRPSIALLRLAAQTNRIFLIHWEHPAPLESFLLPPEGGLDWRVPNWLPPKVKARKKAYKNFQGIREMAEGPSIYLPTAYQSQNYGAPYYNENITDSVGEKLMDDVMADFWKVLFTPAPVAAVRIQQQLEEQQLVPGQYVGIHLRTYRVEPNKVTSNNQTSFQRDVQIALQCGTKLHPSGPFFFASDSWEASRLAVDYGISKSLNVRTISNNDPIHLGFAETTNATMGLSDIFVDLYLLSLGSCVTYGGGGFGQLAYLLNGNRCGSRHGKWGRKCSRMSVEMGATEVGPVESIRESSQSLPTQLFLSPMTEEVR